MGVIERLDGAAVFIDALGRLDADILRKLNAVVPISKKDTQ
jgi:hypothetical protein